MKKNATTDIVVTENVRSIRDCIFTIRGVQVMLDRDLAAVYQVSTSAFNQAVKRNIGRFPPEFRFQLTREEHRFLMSQIVISKRADGLETRGGVRNFPYAFTEQAEKSDMKMQKTSMAGKSLKRDMKFGIFSFFTGAGFLDLGFEDAEVFVFNAEAQRRREGMAA